MKTISPAQGGLYAIYLYSIISLCGIIILPIVSEIDRLVVTICTILGPSIFVYTSIKGIFFPPYPDQDFLTLDEGIFFVLSPFITILCCYFLGFYIIKLYIITLRYNLVKFILYLKKYLYNI